MTFEENLGVVRQCLTGNQDTDRIYVDPGSALDALDAALSEYDSLRALVRRLANEDLRTTREQHMEGRTDTEERFVEYVYDARKAVVVWR